MVAGLGVENLEKPSRPAPIVVTWFALTKLARKTIEELANPKQLLDKKRAKELLYRGAMFLFSALNKVDDDEERLGHLIVPGIKEGSLRGTDVYFASINGSAMQVCVFPQESKFNFSFNSKVDNPKHLQWSFAGPTCIQLSDGGDYLPAELGYFGPEGNFPLFHASGSEIRQSGGLLIKESGEITVVSYDQMQQLFQSHDVGDRLVVMNWRLDSDNPQDTINSPEHWIRQPYNGLIIGRTETGVIEIAQLTTSQRLDIAAGVFKQEELSGNLGTRNDDQESKNKSLRRKLLDKIGFYDENMGEASIPEIFVLINHIAKKRNWAHYDILGTEYIGGHLNAGSPEYLSSYFSVS